MTTFDRIEPRLPELIDELATAHVPDYFDDLLQTTAAARQRPAWRTPERWLPMGVTARPLPRAAVPWRPIIVFALLTMLVLGGLLAYAGSRPRVPAPFGPAGNGTLLYREPDGSIMSVDPTTSATTRVADASAGYGFPIPSRDGHRAAMVRFGSPGPAPIVVTSIDGSDPVSLAGLYQEAQSVDWSPDGMHLAIVARDGRGDGQSVTVAAADGSDATPLALGREVDQIAYLPDGRLALIAAEEPGQACPGSDQTVAPCALFVVNADGTGLDRLISAQDFHGINTLATSPDGSRLLWVEWTLGRTGRLHVFDLAARTDHELSTQPAATSYAINRAWFSPDGTSILFDMLESGGNHWAIIPASGGAIRRIGPEWPGDGSDAAWAPDGRSVLSRYTTSDSTGELWLLDATGSGQDRRLDVQVPDVPSWQRVAD
jgi:hypothetical protein